MADAATGPFSPSNFGIRVGMQALHFTVALRHADDYVRLALEFDQIEKAMWDGDNSTASQLRAVECYSQRNQAGIIAVTFSGMTVEAFLYDFAAEKLGDKFVQTYLDKLEPKAKFLVYPQLVCGKQPDKSRQPFAALSNLVTFRNELVHFKSKFFDAHNIFKASDFHDEISDRMKQGVPDAIDCVWLVVDELDSLQGRASRHLERLEEWVSRKAIRRESNCGYNSNRKQKMDRRDNR